MYVMSVEENFPESTESSMKKMFNLKSLTVLSNTSSTLIFLKNISTTDSGSLEQMCAESVRIESENRHLKNSE